MAWVLVMKMDIEWGGDAFNEISPSVTSLAAIVAHYHMQTETLYFTHVVYAQIC